MIYKIYTFQCEANKFLYGLGKGHQQYILGIAFLLEEDSQPLGHSG